MPINIPASVQEIAKRLSQDVQAQLAAAKPFRRGSWLYALLRSFARRFMDEYDALQDVALESIPDTAIAQLARWGAIFGVERRPATLASGNLVLTGTDGTSVPAGTEWQVDGQIYTSVQSRTISETAISVTLTRSGSTAIATTPSEHLLASNVAVTIAGANETAYNGTDLEILVTSATTFTYQVSGSPATPATGTITATMVYANVPVESDDEGADQNQDADAVLTLQTVVSGADQEAWVDFGELSNGKDTEQDDPFRNRILDRIQNPGNTFSANAIRQLLAARHGGDGYDISECDPVPGCVKIYPRPIPSVSEIAAMNVTLVEIIPAQTDPDDVAVLAATPVVCDFDFSSISPDTVTMRVAVTENVQRFIKEESQVGVNILQDSYRAAIYNTIDTVTGERLASFSLATPGGNITIAAGELAVIGSVTF